MRGRKIRIIMGSRLNADEEFLKFTPTTQEQRNLRAGLLALIESKQTYNFTILKEIVPLGIGKTPKEIQNSISEVVPRGHIMTYKEFLMYKAYKIKELITDYDYKVEEAWREVCDYNGIPQKRKLIRNDVQGGFFTTGLQKCTDYAELYNDLVFSKVGADRPIFEMLDVWVTVSFPNEKTQI